MQLGNQRIRELLRIWEAVSVCKRDSTVANSAALSGLLVEDGSACRSIKGICAAPALALDGIILLDRALLDASLPDVVASICRVEIFSILIHELFGDIINTDWSPIFHLLEPIVIFDDISWVNSLIGNHLLYLLPQMLLALLWCH